MGVVPAEEVHVPVDSLAPPETVPYAATNRAELQVMDIGCLADTITLLTGGVKCRVKVGDRGRVSVHRESWFMNRER